ncbi:MAG TPA: hypothetical protein VK699_16835 [Terriglobales bacterium]|jgi:hypothetical protein|nr:hypothetical protein [Terriglobales bacterium]
MTNTVAFQSELLGNEFVLWAGQPERRVIFHKEDLLAIPCSLLWASFAIVFELAALVASKAGHAWWLGAIWGTPFVIAGQYLIWGRFLYVDWKKSRTFYAVTTERILIKKMKWRGRSVCSLDLFNLGVVQKSIGTDGVGSLQFDYPHVPPSSVLRFLFGPRTMHDSFFDPLERNGTLAFVDIADAEMVYNILMEAREKLEAGNVATESDFLHVHLNSLSFRTGS